MTSNGTGEKKSTLANYSSAGLFFPAATAVGLGMGYFLDKWLNTSPYLLIIFTLYGIVSGFVNLIKLAGKPGKKSNAPEDKTDDKKTP
jgi:ATP synthase protein I